MAIPNMGNKTETCITGVNKNKKEESVLDRNKGRFQLVLLLFLTTFLFVTLPFTIYFSPVNWRGTMSVVGKKQKICSICKDVKYFFKNMKHYQCFIKLNMICCNKWLHSSFFLVADFSI